MHYGGEATLVVQISVRPLQLVYTMPQRDSSTIVFGKKRASRFLTLSKGSLSLLSLEARRATSEEERPPEKVQTRPRRGMGLRKSTESQKSPEAQLALPDKALQALQGPSNRLLAPEKVQKRLRRNTGPGPTEPQEMPRRGASSEKAAKARIDSLGGP